MNTQREDTLNWRESFKLNGRWYEVAPELVQDEIQPQWKVTCGGRKVCTINRTEQGAYRSGPLEMQMGMSLKQAAERAVMRITLPKGPRP